MPRKPKPPRNIEFLENIQDFVPAPPLAPTEAVRNGTRIGILSEEKAHTASILGACLMANEVIRRETGLSDGQIAYRLRAAGVKRLDIRRGRSPYSRVHLETCAPQAARILREQVEQKLKSEREVA